METVDLAGSSVSRATLHNQDQIDRLDIGIGDTVIIQKAGDIIPEIVKVVKEKRQEGTTRFKLPDRCPVCNSLIVEDERCTNPDCQAQLIRNIQLKL